MKNLTVKYVPEPSRARLWTEKHTDFQCLGGGRKESPGAQMQERRWAEQVESLGSQERLWAEQVESGVSGEAVSRAGRVWGLRDGDSELRKISEPPKGSEWDSRSLRPGARTKPLVPG